MFRRLRAIEIAEGALMADIVVVFHLLVKYLPLVGPVFSLLVPPVLTILVLRRGFYTGLMATGVAIFIAGLISGFGAALMLLECGAGLFLGITMRQRWYAFPLILTGAIGSSFGLFVLSLLPILLLGPIAINTLINSLRFTYTSAFAFLNVAMPQIGLGGLWHGAYPNLQHLAKLSLIYWPLFTYLGELLVSIPLVIIVYYITTFLVRLIGYDVRPFPGGWISKVIQWLIRLSLKIALKLGLGKFWSTSALIKEIRRQNIGIGRQKTHS